MNKRPYAKPCPFCGSGVIVTGYTPGVKAAIHCFGCQRTYAYFLEVWNMRPFEDELLETLQLLQTSEREGETE